MHFIPEALDDYVVAHSQTEPKLLQELSKETWQKVMIPRMLSGHFQGRVLSMISKLVNPKNILEIGTYTGYSALCLAEGMQKEGILDTIDHNEELVGFQKKYFEKSKWKNQIIQHCDEASEILPKLNKTYDLVFIDADKSNYPLYIKQILPKLKSGSVILSDNVLWSGKVIEPLNEKDEDTKALLSYNKLLNNHTELETVLLPIRDGLTITRVI
ncbi:MAG: O-methyltransferase [Flavobacteriales bacterium]